MLNKFKMLRCLVNLKIHFLNSYLDFFHENLGNVSEEQECFHQDIKVIEKCCRADDINMIGDYCWPFTDTFNMHQTGEKATSEALKRRGKESTNQWMYENYISMLFLSFGLNKDVAHIVILV